MSRSLVREAVGSRDLLQNLVLRELRATYKSSVLGFAWSLLNPLFTLLIFTFVFGMILNVPVPAPEGRRASFAAFLLVALLPWTLVATALSAGCASLVGNGNLLRKVYFSRATLPASAVLAQGLHFVVALTLLLVYLGVLGIPFWRCLWLLPLPVAAAFMLALGLALITSVANVYFRDTQHLVTLASTAWFYATPIVYPVEMVERFGEPWTTLYRLNPAAALVATFRAILYAGTMPGAFDLAWSLVSAAGVLLAGWTLFRTAEPRLAEEV
ncbi:MAG TPA: ABC transporter permease [Vicinamibacteria bacterium]